MKETTHDLNYDLTFYRTHNNGQCLEYLGYKTLQEDSKYFVQVLKDCFLSVRFDFHQVASKVNIDVTFFDHFPESISILFDGCRIFQPQMNF